MIAGTLQAAGDKPFFVDRDGDEFSYVLDYLRDGSIVLPPSIPKALFQRDLDYYEIKAQDDTVRQSSFVELLESSKRELNRQQMTVDMLSLAAECHYQFSQNADGIGKEPYRSSRHADGNDTCHLFSAFSFRTRQK
jgi:hypothetical protein